MPIAIECACGWQAKVKDEYAGKQTKCRECGAVILVPQPDEDVEARSFDVLKDDSDPPARSQREEEPPERELSPPRPVPPPAAERVPAKKKMPKIEYKARESERRHSGGIVLSGATVASLGMILGGGIWIAIGLSRDRIPISAIILLVLGIINLVRCLMGATEE